MNDPNGRETDANLNEATSRTRRMASPRPVEGVLESSAAPSHPSAWLLVAAIAAAALVQVIAARALLLGWHGTVIGFGADLLLVLGIYCLASAIGRRAGAVLLAVSGVTVSALVLVAAIYLAYSDTLPTVGLLQISGQAGTVLDSVGDLFKSAMLFAFASLPIVAVAAVLRWRTPVTRAYAIGAVAVASLAAFGVAASTSSLLSIGSLNDAVLASRARGIVAYEIASPIAEQEPVLETEAAAADTPTVAERVDELLQVKNASRRAPVPRGVARDKNVIVVQVEALQTLAIGSTINGKEVTPNFNKLARDSWYFPNTISLIWLGNTSDAEFVANTGLMPSKNEPSSIVYGERVVPSLPRRLNDLGYTTETFHANAPEYWNRAELYPSLGFDRFYAQPFFGEDDIIGMGPSDDVLFAKAIERVRELRGADKRYYMDLVTLSSHHPFKAVPTSREPIAMPDEWRETQTGRYLNAEHYADAAFGRFMDELEAEGVLDDTIVIVYGDHFGLSETKPKGSEKDAQLGAFGRELTEPERRRIPMFVLVPDGSKGTIEDPVSQADVMPTVLDLLGEPRGDDPLFGASVFDEHRTLIPLRRGWFATSAGMVVPDFDFTKPRVFPIGDNPAGDVTKKDWQDSNLMLRIASAYERGLPMRAGAGKTQAVIPTPRARRNLKKPVQSAPGSAAPSGQ